MLKKICCLLLIIIYGSILAMEQSKKVENFPSKRDAKEVAVNLFKELPLELILKIISLYIEQNTPVFKHKSATLRYLDPILSFAKIDASFRQIILEIYLPKKLKELISSKKITIDEFLSNSILPDSLIKILDVFHRMQKYDEIPLNENLEVIALQLKEQVMERLIDGKELCEYNADFWKKMVDNHTRLRSFKSSQKFNDKNLIINIIQLKFISFDQNELDAILMRALQNNWLDLIEVIISNGANIEISNGRTPLLWACYFNNYRLAKFLLEKGADVNAQGINGTALIEAVKSCKFVIVALLIDFGADLNFADQNGYTPLMIALSAVDNYSEEIAQMLINASCNINKPDKKNCTPLMFAVCYSRKKIVEMLLNKGVDTNIVNHFGETAALIAQRNREYELAALINQYEQASLSSLLFQLSQEIKNIDFVTILKEILKETDDESQMPQLVDDLNKRNLSDKI